MNKKKENLKTEIDELKTSQKIKKSETCIGAFITLRKATSLELIQ